ncbi:hypothetical protein ACFY0A_37815 [Streptomyces sp. NPDC001698]|uniref:hypothetical protein n=1 Tax=Streptomyces sp. NPDC001698 TaxID=3364601 RepID=UPI0036CDA065
MRKYRCDDCSSTSPVCVTDGVLQQEARRHRNIAHAGLIPDGERVINVPVAKLFDVPRGQAIASALLAAFLIVAFLVRLN